MKKLIIKFNQTGNCIVNIDKVIKGWTDKFSISLYKDEYRLVKQVRGQNFAKLTISKEQAEILIDKLKLLPIKSGLLRSATTYRTESNIISEIERIWKIISEKQAELIEINSIINELKSSLSKKNIKNF